jgi:hypothetical protein
MGSRFCHGPPGSGRKLARLVRVNVNDRSSLADGSYGHGTRAERSTLDRVE